MTTANNNESANRVNRTAIFALAWMFVKQNGFDLSSALRTAWANEKLRTAMFNGVTAFRFVKVSGEIRQAFGTLKSGLVPATSEENRKSNPTVQVYYDTEKGAWRCFKKANLLTA